MTTIIFNGKKYRHQTNETVLDTLLKADIQIPNGCREGVCQSCLMRSLDAVPPSLSQKGLKESLQLQKFFLACRCNPEQDMAVALPEHELANITAIVSHKEALSVDIMRFVLSFQEPFQFFAGQFVNLTRFDGLTRSYSIANLPGQDNILEFHIKRLPFGRFSSWAHNDLKPGTALKVSEAKGSCHYLLGKSGQPMLLIGTGSGLAPLAGIINDALSNNHQAPIKLYHGSSEPKGLYLVDEMRSLAKTYHNFDYNPCVSLAKATDSFKQGRAHDVALADTPNLSGWRVYLCGHPEMVQQSKMSAYLKGASLNDIYADAFYTTPG
ncbi:MAG: 2Fe-2S iron-sulfur cluster binding domain-containing protein [Gammaproteobacteria bacterium]|nr:2Fe-2S iron-sulfur cluster binding domain-containing protein [Gammaproteobacteria bacterium]